MIPQQKYWKLKYLNFPLEIVLYPNFTRKIIHVSHQFRFGSYVNSKLGKLHIFKNFKVKKLELRSIIRKNQKKPVKSNMKFIKSSIARVWRSGVFFDLLIVSIDNKQFLTRIFFFRGTWRVYYQGQDFSRRCQKMLTRL